MSNFYKRYRILNLLLPVTIIALFIALQSGCNKDDECKPPVIDSITLKDSIYKTNDLIPTRVVYIHGKDLNDPTALYIDSNKLSLSYVISRDTMIVFLMPNVASNDPTTELSDYIKVVKSCGSDLIMVNILTAPPQIWSIDNEYAIPGDTLTLEGHYFNLLEKASFPTGTEDEYVQGEIVIPYSDTVCQLIVPEGIGEGELLLYSSSGQSASDYGLILHQSEGLICDFDGLNTWEGYGGQVISADDDNSIPQANGDFFVGSASHIDPGTFNIGSMEMPLRITQTFGYDGRLTPDYFAIKMEIFLKEAWESGYYSIEIGAKAPDNSIAYSYTCNWEPWSDTTLDGSFSTPHWETVQVPMEEFRLTGTENTYLQSYSQIRTINYMDWTFSNPESEEGGKYIPEISVAIDNIRLIQVKSSE